MTKRAPSIEDFENFWNGFPNGNDPFMADPLMAPEAQKRNALDFKPNFQTKRHDIDDYYYL